MQRQEILALINHVLANQGHAPVADEGQTMQEAHFRSLDFSETALRIEQAVGYELNFEAAAMRRIQTIRDVLDFFEGATGNHGVV
jgi:acyl carrier protein